MLETKALSSVDGVCNLIVEKLTSTSAVVELFKGSKLLGQNLYHYLVAAKIEWLQRFSPEDRVEVAGSVLGYDCCSYEWGFSYFTVRIEHKGWAFMADNVTYVYGPWHKVEGWQFRAVIAETEKLEKQIANAIGFKRSYPIQVGTRAFEPPSIEKVKARKVIAKKKKEVQ